MVATLQSRKDALEAKILEKTAELKRLCLQEADLTGVLPPETPLEPGEPPPTVRRRVGTSFSFPQSLLNNINGADDATLGDLEVKCQLQSKIAEAALAVANDTTVSKSVRRKHRLMYRQSQRHLMELETRLTLLKQGVHQPIKPQQAKKKPRPNTTALDNGQLIKDLKEQKMNGYYTGQWPIKTPGECYGEEDLRYFSSLHRPSRSSGTSHSSNSPRLSVREMAAYNCSGLPDLTTITSSLSQPNIQDMKPYGNDIIREIKRSERRNSGRRQWDSQSAGGTLLPNQTYPDSHLPNLNRAQSLGSVDGQRPVKEKEWYETSLDSAPSPPLRTSSRLPPSARMLYHLQEMQIRDAVNKSLLQPRAHPVLTRTHRATPVDEMSSAVQSMRITPPQLSTPVDTFHDNRPAESRPTSLPIRPTYEHIQEHSRTKHEQKRTPDAVYIDIPDDEVDSLTLRRSVDGSKTPTPTTPYYHIGGGWTPIPDIPEIHPPHAATQEEIKFDTVVPFESPQNHTVVQAGIWQPYREVSKPFEMSDFYKYSTKFRQARQSPRTDHPPVQQRTSDASGALLGVYQPLRPQTCQPVERNPLPSPSYVDPPPPVPKPRIL